ncbi:MAG: hypothetical protein AAF366_16945 [Pseudomonadota bacterium]
MFRLTAVIIIFALPAAGAVDCYCRDGHGGQVQVGDATCLTVDGRTFLAVCDMSLNVPIWRDRGACPVG